MLKVASTPCGSLLPQGSLGSWGEIRGKIEMLQSIHNLIENNFLGKFLICFNDNKSLEHITRPQG